MGLTPPTGGTPRYMAPELLTAGQVSTKQSDIYSFGMVAYQVTSIVTQYLYTALKGHRSSGLRTFIAF